MPAQGTGKKAQIPVPGEHLLGLVRGQLFLFRHDIGKKVSVHIGKFHGVTDAEPPQA